MRLNKKGVTLVELIVSISLISVVVIFMYRMLIDINDEMTNSAFAVSNQRNRLEVIKYIESDILDKNLTKIEKGTLEETADEKKLKIKLYSEGKTATIELKNIKPKAKSEEKYQIKYESFDGITTKWTIKDAYLNFTNEDDIIICQQPLKNGDFLLNISIKITNQHVKNTKENNNILDDIIISYHGTNELNNINECE